MEKGHEGDEIVLLSFRQSGFSISPHIKSLEDLNADEFVSILSQSLVLITSGELQFPGQLPTNIAARHRICTDIAAKIKDLGFAGDCGYNQLLYPVAEQSRVLLAWIVDKLPKSEEERVEEALGANALLSKKIRDSLVLWKSIFWHPSFCCDTLLKNRYHNHELRTVKFASHIRKYPTAIEVYKSCIIMKHFIDPSIFERHKLEMVHDATYASKLESDFEDGEFNQINDGLDSYNKSFPRGNAEFTGTSIRNSISQAVHRSNTFQSQLNDDSSSSPFYAGGANNPSANNLNDFIISLKNENQRGGFSDVFERKSRFEHAVEFMQDVGALSSLDTKSRGLLSSNLASGLTSSDWKTRKSQHDTSERSIGDIHAETATEKKVRLDEEEKNRMGELDELRNDLLHATISVEELVVQQASSSSIIRQMENEISKLSAETETLEKDIIMKKKTLEMLPDATDNIAKLQDICGSSSSRLLQLAQEWEIHRRPLVENLREVKAKKAKRRAKCKLMIEEMKRYREEMMAMLQDLKEKQDRAQLLADEMSKLPKNLNRAIYTHRIMDITASIVKQNKDIENITTDIRNMQKSINLVSNTLQRADAITEEMIYEAANRNPGDTAMVDTYRRLKTLRSHFEQLILTVNKIGQQEKLLRDLETRIDQERSRISVQNTDRIKEDLKQIVQANMVLVAEIKSKRK